MLCTIAKRTGLLLTAAAALTAQTAVQGPTVGWIFDSTVSGLRPVLGIPGSSTLGAKSIEAEHAAVSPDGRFALLATADKRMIRVDLRTGAQSSLEAEPTNEIVFSPSGSASLFIYRDIAKAVLRTNDAARELNFEKDMPARFAISDDGALVLASGDQLLAVDQNGNRWPIDMNGVRDVAFIGNSHDALVANAKGLWMVRDAGSNAVSSRIWEGDAQQVAWIKTSALVLTEEKSLHAVNLASGESSIVACTCEPQVLAQMSHSIIRVSGLTKGPIWLVDWNGEEPRAVFVPAESKSEE